jgi:FdhD protein
MNPSSSPDQRIKMVSLRKVDGRQSSEDKDFLAAEEPLEIQVEGTSVAVVMRTPGEDLELAAGFLVTEGLIRHAGDLKEVRHKPHCLGPARNKAEPVKEPPLITASGGSASGNGIESNVIDVRLSKPESFDFKRLTRHVFSSSSCGVCSKASIAAVQQQFPRVDDRCQIDTELLVKLPEALAAAQKTFKRTGGLHACALFDLAGDLVVLREDVGRHNALDKVVGWALFNGRLPLSHHVLLLSGRASFEMMQKSLAAGIPIVAAISAPSSLAVEFARDSGQTLIGFLRGQKMNIYAGHDRLLSRIRKNRLSGFKPVRSKKVGSREVRKVR